MKGKVFDSSLFYSGDEFWFEFPRIIKNCLKVGKNGLKVRFDSIWWVPYNGLLFEGGHDIDFRELEWVGWV